MNIIMKGVRSSKLPERVSGSRSRMMVEKLISYIKTRSGYPYSGCRTRIRGTSFRSESLSRHNAVT
jgi:hypothetical protein